MHVHRKLARRDLHALGAAHACVHERNAELFDAKFAARHAARWLPTGSRASWSVALERYDVHAELRRAGNAPGRHGAAPPVPLERLGVLLPAALVDDPHARRKLRGIEVRETLRGFGADEMLHRDGFPCPQQRAVEYRMRADFGIRLEIGRQIEAPGLDAFLPLAEDEARVDDALGGTRCGRLARRHEVTLVDEAIPGLDGERGADAGETLRIGATREDLSSAAVVNGYVGAVDRLALVERRHPDEAVLAAVLEVDAEIGDEHAGAHVHRSALVEERRAETRRLDLDDVVSGSREWNADDLEGPRIDALQLRQVEPFHVGGAVQQRHLARFDVPLDAALDRATLRVDGILDGVPLRLRQPRFARRHAALVVAGHPRVPGQDVGIALDALDADAASVGAARLRSQIALHVPQRHGQHRIGACFDDAERRGSEFGERWGVSRRDFQRERAGVGERAAAVVLEIARDLEGERRVFGQRRGERDFAHFVSLVVPVEDRFPRGAGRRAELHLFGRLPCHRRREAQHHRSHRQARRVRSLALATEFGVESLANPVAVALLDRGPHLRVPRGGDAFAPDEPHGGIGRQRARAGHEQRSRRALAVDPSRPQQRFARGSGHDDDRQTLADPLDLAPGIRRHGRRVHRTAQREQEMLIFLDVRAVPRLRRDDGRATRAEAPLRSSGEPLQCAGGTCGRGGLPRGTQLQRASDTGRDELAKVVLPDPVVDPAAGAVRCGTRRTADRRGPEA